MPQSAPKAVGRYEIRATLGSGAFASAYLAVDPVLDTDGAIEVLADRHARDPDLRRRFIDEARTMRMISGDRLVTIHDIGEADGRPYFVMAPHRSGTLRERLRDVEPPIADDQLVRMIDEITECLRPVHRHRVVHREGSSRFTTWLHRVATNEAKMLIRARERRPATAVAEPTAAPFLARLSTILADRDLVDRALAELPDDLRRTMILREIDGLDYAAIASEMEVEIGTVRSRLHRGRAQLVEELRAHLG